MAIGIIGAMDEEVEKLITHIYDQKKIEVAGCLFVEGSLSGKDVVLLQSGIGKVNAAMATSIMHERFAPSHVINTGSAGGFASELEVGDIVISTEIVHHDVDVTGFNYAYGQVPEMPATFTANRELIRLAEIAIAEMNIHFKSGVIATGDSFMNDPDRVQFVREKFPGMLAAEMEAAAIAQVCFRYKTPFVITRSLSDIAGKESSVSFDAFLDQAAKNSASLVMAVVDQL